MTADDLSQRDETHRAETNRTEPGDGASTTALPDGWSSVTIPSVEHTIVVGPGGMFLLAVRRHHHAAVRLYDRGLWVDGRRTNDLATAEGQARFVSTVLTERCGRPVVCEPVIVVHTDDLVVRSRPDDVHVLPAHLLRSWLAHLPARLRPIEVADVLARALAISIDTLAVAAVAAVPAA